MNSASRRSDRLAAIRPVSLDGDLAIRALESLGLPLAVLGADRPPAGPPMLYLNPAFTELTGFDQERVSGRGLDLLFGAETRPGFVERVRAALADGTSLVEGARLHGWSGEVLAVDFELHPLPPHGVAADEPHAVLALRRREDGVVPNVGSGLLSVLDGRLALLRSQLEDVVRDLDAATARSRVAGVFQLLDSFLEVLGTAPEVVRTAREAVAAPPADPLANAAEALAILSPREREVLRMLVGGQRPKAIAESLSISPHTVRNHVRAIYGKLDVHSQVDLIRKVQG